jgi:hypothetical protein
MLALDAERLRLYAKASSHLGLNFWRSAPQLPGSKWKKRVRIIEGRESRDLRYFWFLNAVLSIPFPSDRSSIHMFPVSYSETRPSNPSFVYSTHSPSLFQPEGTRERLI